MAEIPAHVRKVSSDLDIYPNLMQNLVSVVFLENDDIELTFTEDGINQIYDPESAMGIEWAAMVHPGSSLMVYMTIEKNRQDPIILFKELSDGSRVEVPLP